MLAKGSISAEHIARWFSPAVLARKVDRLHKKIDERQRAAGGSVEELQVCVCGWVGGVGGKGGLPT
jgi:hypothetical protein